MSPRLAQFVAPGAVASNHGSGDGELSIEKIGRKALSLGLLVGFLFGVMPVAGAALGTPKP